MPLLVCSIARLLDCRFQPVSAAAARLVDQRVRVAAHGVDGVRMVGVSTYGESVCFPISCWLREVCFYLQADCILSLCPVLLLCCLFSCTRLCARGLARAFRVPSQRVSPFHGGLRPRTVTAAGVRRLCLTSSLCLPCSGLHWVPLNEICLRRFSLFAGVRA